MFKSNHFLFLLSTLVVGCASQNESRNAGFDVPSVFVAPNDHMQYTPMLNVDGSVNDIVTGVWFSNSFGVLLDLPLNGPPRQFLTSAAGCFIENLEISDISDLFHVFLAEDENGVAFFADHPGGALYPFRRLDALPGHCIENTNKNPAENLEAFLQYADTHYPAFAERDIAWESLKGRARQMINSHTDDGTLFDALSMVVNELNDAHTEIWDAEIAGVEHAVTAGRGKTLNALHATFDTTDDEVAEAREFEWVLAYRQWIADDILQGEGKRAARGLIDWGWVSDNVGYIQILGFGDYVREGGLSASVDEAHRVMNEALKDLDGAEAIIVDASQNRGGYDVLARAVASHFTVEKQVVYRSRPYHHEENRWQEFDVDPSNQLTFTKPVLLMTSDITVSAGEIFVLAMRSFSHVRQIGMKTRGALSVEIARTLPNGWAFGMSSEVILDQDGKWYEGVGIPVNENMIFFPAGEIDGQTHIDSVRSLAKRFDGVKLGTVSKATTK